MLLREMLFVSLCFGIVWAGPGAASLDTVKALFESRSYDSACQKTDELIAAYPYDVQVNLFYGRCALHRGDLDAAMAAYDRAEILDDASADVQKSLGDLYVKMGHIPLANTAYERAERLSGAPVERLGTRSPDAHRLSLFMQLDAGYDGNVEYSAELSDMAEWLGTADANLSAPESALFVKEYAGLSYLYDSDPSSPYYLKSTLSAYNKNFESFSDADLLEISLTAGPGWRSGTVDFTLAAGYSYIAQGYESYLERYSITPKLRKGFQNGLQLTVEADYSRQKNREWDGADQDIYSAGLGLGRWLENNYLHLNYRYLVADNTDAQSPRVFVDRSFHEADAGVMRRWSRGVEAGVKYLYRDSSYDDVADIADPAKRSDTLQRYTAFASYLFGEGMRAVLQYEFYENETNYTPADYTKEVVSLGLSLEY